MANFSAMVLKLVKRSPVANATEQFVKGVPEGTWRVVPAQSAERRVKLAECWMREMRFRCVAHFEMIQMTQCNVKLAKLRRKFRLTDLSACEVRSVVLGDLVAVNQNTALGGAGAAAAPWIVKRSEVSNGGTPLESTANSLRR